MPLFRVGESCVKFREVARKEPSTDVVNASAVFPELSQFGWPDRGSAAERSSLLLQARRFKIAPRPTGLEEACKALLKQYPRSTVLSCFRGEKWDWETIIAAAAKKTLSSEINLTASPGVPCAALGSTNDAVLSRHRNFVVAAVVERLYLLMNANLKEMSKMSPVELVAAGFCDPVRLFVKQEPHPVKKLAEGRYRLISSVSLVDQLVERMLFGPQNTLEIDQWYKIPSKPGMGLSSRDQQRMIWQDVKRKHHLHPAAEADISGFDWTVQEWELWSDVEIRIALAGVGRLPVSNCMRARFYCFMNSVFQTSSGELIAQGYPGIMKSGSYCTSSTNSRVRCLMAELIGAPWCIAMGDDSVEGFVPGAKEKYLKLGHTCKDYVACKTYASGELEKFNFCSHEITSHSCWLTSWPKTLFRFLSSDGSSKVELEMELRSSPVWNKIHNYLSKADQSLSSITSVFPPSRTKRKAEDLVDLTHGCENDQGSATGGSGCHEEERDPASSSRSGPDDAPRSQDPSSEAKSEEEPWECNCYSGGPLCRICYVRSVNSTNNWWEGLFDTDDVGKGFYY
ncbi:P2ab [Mimosa mosaic virus]|uniref:RNA-directed RNA polymerase n=1 Tax=Mimosa mosaic virus TaxID=3018030 RepID=A0AA95EFJ6_9VIRU|nr:P2ab [Mimosa mosaic virus]